MSREDLLLDEPDATDEMDEEESKSKKKKNEAAVTFEHRKMYDWLDLLAEKVVKAATEKKKIPFMKIRLARSLIQLAKSFCSLKEKFEKAKENMEAKRKIILAHWAQQDVTILNGVTVAPKTALSLDLDALMPKLSEESRAKVIRLVETFSLEMLLELADRGEVSKDDVRDCLRAKVTVSVEGPKKKKK